MTKEIKTSPAVERGARRASETPIEGVIPFEFKVVVKPVKVSKASLGGIEYPDEIIDQMQRAVCKGKIVAISPLAFTYFDTETNTYAEVQQKFPETPRVGDLVLFGRYCGNEIWASDGELYRVMNDKDIIARIDESVRSFDEKLLGH